MATIKLYWNSTNTVPTTTTSPEKYRSLTVFGLNDRGIETEKVQDKLIDRSIVETVLGLRRHIYLSFQVSDIKANVDFFTSFLNAPYKWLLCTDTGFYFNIGTPSSPTPVPVVVSSPKMIVDVETLLMRGITLSTASLYQASAIGSGDWTATNSGGNSSIAFTLTNFVLVNIYQSDTSGGTYTLVGTATASPKTITGGSGKYFKISKVGIYGEGELSAYKQSTAGT